MLTRHAIPVSPRRAAKTAHKPKPKLAQSVAHETLNPQGHGFEPHVGRKKKNMMITRGFSILIIMKKNKYELPSTTAYYSAQEFKTPANWSEMRYLFSRININVSYQQLGTAHLKDKNKPHSSPSPLLQS